MYSKHWFNIFLADYPKEKTAKEIEFIRKIVPGNKALKILDLCCGDGRHLEFFQNMYDSVTGIDINDYALQKAELKLNGSVKLIEMDMRLLGKYEEKFNAIFSLWQSFGYYSEEENFNILRSIHTLLLSGGYFLLDIYNLEFFRGRTSKRIIKQKDKEIIEETALKNNRLSVKLTYQDKTENDMFEWELYSPQSITKKLVSAGFNDIRIFSDFNYGRQATEKDHRMQVLARK